MPEAELRRMFLQNAHFIQAEAKILFPQQPQRGAHVVIRLNLRREIDATTRFAQAKAEFVILIFHHLFVKAAEFCKDAFGITGKSQMRDIPFFLSFAQRRITDAKG